MSSDTWSYQQLGEVFPKIVVGYVGNVNKYYCDKNEGVPFYRTLNIRDGYFNNHDKKYVTREFNDRNKKSQIENGDILIARVGANLGMICQVNGISGPANIANAIVIKSRYIKSGHPKFFAYFLVSPVGKNQIYSRAAGGAQGVFNTKLTQSLIVPNPPIAEQKKIARILSTWDKAITTTEQLLANSQQLKQALMQQLLTGKRRLLNESGERFSGEWISLQLGEFTEITTGKSKSKFVTEDGQNFIVDMGSVNRQGKLVPSKRTNLDSDYLQVGHLVMPKDDIGGGNILGRAGYITENNKFILGDHVYALKVSEHDSLFISYLINSYAVNKSLRRKANGTAQLGLGKKDVLRQVIHIPSSNSEQQSIASVLFTVDQEISKLQFKVASLKTEKKALMQQLLTGKRRVKVDEEAA